MERRLKERLIGASILVVLIVLVVPELLSGPKSVAPAPHALQLPAAASSDEAIRNVTVDLTTSKAPATADPETASEPASTAAVPAPDAASTMPAAAAPVPAAPAPPMPAAPVPAVPRPVAVESSAPPPISKGGAAHGEVSRPAAWAVQLGSFANRANADNLVHQLKAQGFAVYVLSGGSGAATRHRVRVGPLTDRDAAERTAAKLKALGHASSLVSPGA
jgi:DedD protein